MSRFLDKAIAVGMLAAVIFTALAFGANEPWSVGLFQLLIAALIIMWAVKSAVDRRVRVAIPAAALPVAGLLAIGFAQSFAYVSGDGQIHSLSMDVEATRGAALMLLFLLASFIIARNFFATRERLGALANVLIIFGLAMSVFALMQHFTWDGRIYWLRPTQWNIAFGPFVNRNHYAGYMEMLAPLPLALILGRGVRKESWVFYGFAAAVMGLSIFVSLSRGGMISLMAGIAFATVMSAKATGARRSAEKKGSAGKSFIFRRMGVAAALSVAILFGVFWIGGEKLVNRAAESIDQMKSSPDQPSSLFLRQEIWKDTLKMISARPILGAGLGAYEAVFPRYARHDGTFVVNYSHNDYLQALSDAGILGGALAILFIALIFRAMARGLKSEDPFMASLALGCGAGVFSLLTHSMFDFNLQIPSNALLFLFLSAVITSIAASAGKREAKDEASRAVSNVGGYQTGALL
jgi:O-antigen ligase